MYRIAAMLLGASLHIYQTWDMWQDWNDSGGDWLYTAWQQAWLCAVANRVVGTYLLLRQDLASCVPWCAAVLLVHALWAADTACVLLWQAEPPLSVAWTTHSTLVHALAKYGATSWEAWSDIATSTDMHHFIFTAAVSSLAVLGARSAPARLVFPAWWTAAPSLWQRAWRCTWHTLACFAVVVEFSCVGSKVLPIPPMAVQLASGECVEYNVNYVQGNFWADYIAPPAGLDPRAAVQAAYHGPCVEAALHARRVYPVTAQSILIDTVALVPIVGTGLCLPGIVWYVALYSWLQRKRTASRQGGAASQGEQVRHARTTTP